MSAPAPVIRSLGKAGWAGWDERLGYLWNSISLAPCNSQEHHREDAERIFSGPRRGIQLSNESNAPGRAHRHFRAVAEGPRETEQRTHG